MTQIKKNVLGYYLITGDDSHTLKLELWQKQKLNGIKKKGYFKWYMPGFQDIKETSPSPGYWKVSNVLKIEKITETTYVEVEEI